MCCGPLSSSVPSYSDDIHTAKQKPHPLVVRTVCFWARIAYVPGTIHIYPVSNLRGEPRCQVLRYQAGCKRLKSQSSCIVIAATSLLVVEPVGAKASKQPTPCTRLHSLLLYPMTTVRSNPALRGSLTHAMRVMLPPQQLFLLHNIATVCTRGHLGNLIKNGISL